ncbi:amidohydrolase family protein [Chitinophaga sp. Cy-1792]|uniref:amidohydrolase family protein n=1 Tax=Chitinophaga sp. Cy-1792 TaxID=2608339 RepID=UPI00141FBC97|nr:amidohydrolase family protein [Chitinophaga sp. Cy-1792]NIG57616.1 amidohydrolase [Chitinophaga sp. Cy-1792]
MRIITLEEHISLAPFSQQIQQWPFPKDALARLGDITETRLQSMNDNGIDIQVLSIVGRGAESLPAAEAIQFASSYNDFVASQIALHPTRFKAFAHLPMCLPEAAALELERAREEHSFCGAMINGLTNGKFLDLPEFRPLLAKAEQLQIPLYLHPGLPPAAVAGAYYNDLPGSTGIMLGCGGWGWHSETALQVLRLIITGTLDRYPQLKLIIGHMGEMIPMMMSRLDEKFPVNSNSYHQRTISQTLRDQVYITTSGIFTLPPFFTALETFGIDNIMFSVDYPFSTNEAGRQFLDSIPLSMEEVEKIAGQNAAQLINIRD